MLSVPGVYEDGVVTLLEPIPNIRTANVIITVLETHHPLPETLPFAPVSDDWLGAMRGTAQIVGDIIEPIEDSADEWQVLHS